MTGADSLMETEGVKEEQPFDLINRISTELFSQGRKASPKLYAIQELEGAQAGEKYRIINQVVKAKSKKDAEPKYQSLNVPAQLQDFVTAKVNIEMESIDEIIRCLKSEDKTLGNQALKAKWFFHHTNPNLNKDFFASTIIPHISEYMRFRIIKALSRCLVPAPNKAEEFFTFFADTCGSNVALPLLTACSEEFIYNEVLKRKLILGSQMLLTIYKRRPKAAIQYLNLGHYKDEKNDDARKIHSIEISDYKKFIPHLIRHDIEFFIELVESYFWGWGVKIGSTLTLLFFKKATNVFIEKPHKFMHFWSINVISKRLTMKQYEAMYFSLFPKTFKEFRPCLKQMIGYLKGYPKEKRYNLISTQFKLKYQKDFVESLTDIKVDELNEIYNSLSVDLYEKLCINLFPITLSYFDAKKIFRDLQQYPENKRLNLLVQTYQSKYGQSLFDNTKQLKSEEIFKLVPLDVKTKLAKDIIEPYEIKSSEYYSNCYYLPLSECFAVYKEAIQKSSNVNDRFTYLEKMLLSCFLYNNMEDLLQVIKYYSMRHANEKVDKFQEFLVYIERKFDLKSIGDKNWIAILELFQKLSIRGELCKVANYCLEKFFVAAAHCAYCVNTEHSFGHENKQSIITMLNNIVIDYNMDQSTYQIWTLSSEYPLIQKACFDALLQCFLRKYSPKHPKWKQDGSTKKASIVNSILIAMNNYNAKLKKQSSLPNCKEYDVREYPLLLDMTKELFDLKDALRSFSALQRTVNIHSPELYNLLMGKSPTFASNFTVDIKSGLAWVQLKKSYSEVMEHWHEYLNECRQKLNNNSKRGGAAARRFLLSSKWYNSLPVNFVEKCLKELDEPGSLKVLAILLDSEVFTSLINDFAPKQLSAYQDAKEYFAFVKNIPPAINFVNPPVTFEVIIMYCQGNFTRVAVQAFEHVIHLVSKEKILAFADNLISKPVSVKKHGIRLIFKSAPSGELLSFVINLLTKENHASIREFICSESQERLIKDPTAENWRLVQLCISALTVQDEPSLILLCNVKKMKNSFLPEYVAQLLKKIDELSKDPEFPEAIKTKCICTFLSNFTLTGTTYLSEQIILQLLERYYFDTDSLEISTAAQAFAKHIFSQRYLQKIKQLM